MSKKLYLKRTDCRKVRQLHQYSVLGQSVALRDTTFCSNHFLSSLELEEYNNLFSYSCLVGPQIFLDQSEVGIYKRKQESMKTRKSR